MLATISLLSQIGLAAGLKINVDTTGPTGPTTTTNAGLSRVDPGSTSLVQGYRPNPPHVRNVVQRDRDPPVIHSNVGGDASVLIIFIGFILYLFVWVVENFG